MNARLHILPLKIQAGYVECLLVAYYSPLSLSLSLSNCE